jgi:uracil-DNA glycosylase
VSRDDGLTLSDCWVTAAVRCAPPANKPSPDERDNCLPWLQAELALLDRVRVVVCLGSFAWDCALRVLGGGVRPRPKFGHGAVCELGSLSLLGCYHPSQQNTFTGKLTEAMLDEVFARAREVGRGKN